MEWIKVAGITICVILIILYEWPKMNQNQKREKVAFASLTAIGWLLALFLLFFPDMPGPTKMITHIFKPIIKIFEK